MYERLTCRVNGQNFNCSGLLFLHVLKEFELWEE